MYTFQRGNGQKHITCVLIHGLVTVEVSGRGKWNGEGVDDRGKGGELPVQRAVRVAVRGDGEGHQGAHSVGERAA